MKKNKGFTLLELIVVLVLMGILTVMASPMYKKSKNNNDLDKSAGELISALQASRYEAMFRGKPVQFISNNVQESVYVADNKKIFRWQTYGDTWVAQKTSSDFYFDSNGRALVSNGDELSPLITPVNPSFLLCSNSAGSQEVISRRISISYLGTFADSGAMRGCDAQ